MRIGVPKWTAIVATAVASFGCPPAPAYASSCGVTTFTAQGTGCVYRASEAGEYRAAAISGWRISISRDGEPFAVVLAASPGRCSVPGGAVSTGTIPARAGDLVKLEIAPGCVSVGAPRMQAGYLAGGDRTAMESTPGGLPPLTQPVFLDPHNSCVATNTTPGRGAGLASFDSLTCAYMSARPLGAVIVWTPNRVKITASDGRVLFSSLGAYDGTANFYVPKFATYQQPVGDTITISAGPDPAFGNADFIIGSIGLVAAGDSNF